MLSWVWSISLLALQAMPDAVAMIANGADADAAGEKVAAMGRPGLWALHEAAKKHDGAARGRLFEAIGRFGSDEAEWALIVELKSADLEGRAGAIRGLARMKRAKTASQVLNAANVESAGVRDAAALYLRSIGDPGRAQATRLLDSSVDHQRAIALAYALAAQDFDLSNAMFRVAELARSPSAEVSELAARVLAKNGGAMAAGELASIVSDPATKEIAWLRSAELLTAMGLEGRRELIGAIGRARDDAKRARLAAIAAKDASREEIGAMVELLDDPSPDRREAAKAILLKTGATGREVARAHLPRALPELEAAIRAFLAAAPAQPKDLEASR